MYDNIRINIFRLRLIYVVIKLRIRNFSDTMYVNIDLNSVSMFEVRSYLLSVFSWRKKVNIISLQYSYFTSKRSFI